MKDIRNQSNNASVQSNSASVQECYSTAMQESCSAEAQNHRSTDLLPALRFNGFSEEWEVRKLGEVADRIIRKNTNNVSTLPLTISAQYGLVDQITYFNNRVASRDVSNYYLVLNGEFAYNKSTSDGYPFGAVKRLDLYDKGVLSTLYTVFALKDKQKTNSDFLTVFFDTDRWHKDISERASEGARNHGLLNISADDFFDINISLPNKVPEQSRIGTFFRSLDNLIALRTRKLEKLRNIKKAFLEKMFVGQNSSASEQESCSAETQNHLTTDSRPAIRFKGFTEEWEVRKLGEVGEYQSSSLTAQNIDENGKYDLYDANSLIGKTNKSYMQCDYITIIKDGAGVGRTRLLPKFSMFLGTMGAIIPKKSELYFLYQIITNANLGKSYTGSTIPHIYFKDYGKNEYSFPSLAEQSRIGAFFRSLDNLIALQEKELTKLRNIKQACLQRMFV